MFMMSCSFIILMVPGRAACHAPYEDVMGVLAILTTSPYFLFFCRFVFMKHFLLIDNVSMTISSRQPFELWPRTYDGYSALHTQNSMYLNGESWVWRVNPECRVLSIHHTFWVKALNLWRFLSTLHFKLQHQIHVFEWGILKCGRIHIIHSGIPNQIHEVLSVECWVSVISLGPGEDMSENEVIWLWSFSVYGRNQPLLYFIFIVIYIFEKNHLFLLNFFSVYIDAKQKNILIIEFWKSSFLQFLLFIRGTKIVGPFVVMIYKMIRGDLLRFFTIYVVFLIGFSQGEIISLFIQQC